MHQSVTQAPVSEQTDSPGVLTRNASWIRTVQRDRETVWPKKKREPSECMTVHGIINPPVSKAPELGSAGTHARSRAPSTI